MHELLKIYDRLKLIAKVDYSIAPETSPTGERTKPLEVLTLSDDKERQRLVIEFFGVSPTKVTYSSTDIDTMVETVDALKLPTSWPTNVGEKVFHLFRNELRYKPPLKPEISHYVRVGKERQFYLILSKLATVLSGKIIDQEFYESQAGSN